MFLRILSSVQTDTARVGSVCKVKGRKTKMDKSKVIAAYKRGFITVHECGQILGVEEMQLKRLLQLEESKRTFPHQSQPTGS